jgi:hypothetical protein
MGCVSKEDSFQKDRWNDLATASLQICNRTVRPVQYRALWVPSLCKSQENSLIFYRHPPCLPLIEPRRRLAVRRLLNRCGDRELLLALMALVGSIVALVII